MIILTFLYIINLIFFEKTNTCIKQHVPMKKVTKKNLKLRTKPGINRSNKLCMSSIHFERRRGRQSFASISKLIGYLFWTKWAGNHLEVTKKNLKLRTKPGINRSNKLCMSSIHFERRRGRQSFASISKLIGYLFWTKCAGNHLEVTKKNLKLRTKPRINSDIQKLISYRDKLFAKMVKSPSAANKYL